MKKFFISLVTLSLCILFVSCSKYEAVYEKGTSPDKKICSTLEFNYVNIEIVSTDDIHISLYGKSGRTDVHFELCTDASNPYYGKYAYFDRVDCSLICYENDYHFGVYDSSPWKYSISGVNIHDAFEDIYIVGDERACFPGWCRQYSVISRGSCSVHISIQANQ